MVPIHADADAAPEMAAARNLIAEIDASLDHRAHALT